MRKRRSRGFRPRGEHLDERCLLSGFAPSQIAAAYGVGGITFQSSSGAKVAGDGTGQTIAIIDLYHDPNLQASLNAFDAQYNLPNITLDVINQAGNSDRCRLGGGGDRWTSSGRTPSRPGRISSSWRSRRARRTASSSTNVIAADPHGQPDGRGLGRLHELGLRRVLRRDVLRLQLHDRRGHLRRLERGHRHRRMARDLGRRAGRRRDLAHAGLLGRVRLRDRLVAVGRRSRAPWRTSRRIRMRSSPRAIGARPTSPSTPTRIPASSIYVIPPDNTAGQGSGRSSAARASARPPGPGSWRSSTRAAPWPDRRA